MRFHSSTPFSRIINLHKNLFFDPQFSKLHLNSISYESPNVRTVSNSTAHRGSISRTAMGGRNYLAGANLPSDRCAGPIRTEHSGKSISWRRSIRTGGFSCATVFCVSANAADVQSIPAGTSAGIPLT
jgi:hypothetical protein